MSHHQTEDILVTCGDPRYTSYQWQRGLDAILKDATASRENVFGLRFLGASLGLVLDVTKPAWRWQLETATKLGAKRLILVDHLDCGAFREQFGEMSQQEERTKHLETLKTAAAFVRRFLPKLQVACYLQDGLQFEKLAA